MNHARLLAAGHVHVPARIIPGLPSASSPYYLYVPLGFRPTQDRGELVPTYPLGFALFIAALKPIAGWKYAGDLAIILHSLAGILAMYGICRALHLERRWALLGALIVALSPLYVFMSLQAMSDVPSLCWTGAAILAALKSREHASWALAAGMTVAIAVLVRPTNILVFVPLAIALGLSPRRWILYLAGALPGALFFATYTHAAYGGYVATGYGDVSKMFLAAYVPETLLHYCKWLPALLTPLVALAVGLPWIRGVAPWTKWLLGSWIIVFGAFYSGYVCTHETWWYLRFLLPAVPALVAASLLVLRSVLSRLNAHIDPSRSLAAYAAILALVALSSGWWIRNLHALSVGKEERRYGLIADWLGSNISHEAVCLCMQASGALFYYTNLTIVRWDMVNDDNVEMVKATIRLSKKPFYAVLFPFELDLGAFSKHVPGNWKLVGHVETATVWRCDLDSPKP